MENFPNYLKFEEKIEYILENPYAHLNTSPTVSKSQQKKCSKGLHTYKKREHKSTLECIYCNKTISYEKN